jgi:hypothetical protein
VTILTKEEREEHERLGKIRSDLANKTWAAIMRGQDAISLLNTARKSTNVEERLSLEAAQEKAAEFAQLIFEAVELEAQLWPKPKP